jgi:hypothetical protein
VKFVSALNAVHDNVWALVIIGGGIGLTCCHQKETGLTLITLGAAVFQKSAKVNSEPSQG